MIHAVGQTVAALNRRKVRYVWCAEDEKYGLMGVYATKKEADKDFGDHVKPWPWPSGYGGTIIKRKVHE